MQRKQLAKPTRNTGSCQCNTVACICNLIAQTLDFVAIDVPETVVEVVEGGLERIRELDNAIGTNATPCQLLYFDE